MNIKKDLDLLCDQTLILVKQLCLIPIDSKNNFQVALRLITIKNYYTLRSVQILYQDIHSGDCVMDLSRRVLEDNIAVLYILLKGKDKMAQQFINYAAVESKLYRDFLHFGGKFDKKMDKKSAKLFRLVEKEFTYKKNEVFRSWAKCSVEDMIKALVDAGVMDDTQKEYLLQSYMFGNKKNHLSPADVMSFLNEKVRSANHSVNKELGMLFTLIHLNRIAMILAEELDQRDLLRDLNDLMTEIQGKP